MSMIESKEKRHNSLISLNNEKFTETLFPPKIKLIYSDFEFVSETSYYKVYEAKNLTNGQKHAIRVLDTESPFVIKNHNLASTLFMQEALRLSLRLPRPDLVIIENFEIYEDKIAFVMKPYNSIQNEPLANDGKLNIDAEKMLKDCLAEINFLYVKMKLGSLSLDVKNICRAKDTNTFFLTDWASAKRLEPQKDVLNIVVSQELQVPNIAAKDVYMLALVLLELNGAKRRECKELLKIENQDKYDILLDDVVKKVKSEWLQKAIHNMLQRESGARARFDEIRERYGLQVAWSSYSSNIVSIYDLQANKLHDSFRGVQLKDEGGYTFIEQMPNSDYLISLHHLYERAASFEVFDSSQYMKNVFSFGEVQDVVGIGDISCNAKKNVAALISIKDKTAYHLFDCKSLKITKKAKWQSKHADMIASFDLDPEGNKMFTIDRSGVCLLSEVDTDAFVFDIFAGESYYNKCRWSPAIEMPIVAVKFEKTKLNLIDIPKKAFLMKEPLSLDANSTLCIDWRRDGNLIASSGWDQNVKIFDRREGKTVRTFNNLHSHWIRAVRWSPFGNTLATAAQDGSIKVVDFASGRLLYLGNTPDGKAANSICFLDIIS